MRYLVAAAGVLAALAVGIAQAASHRRSRDIQATADGLVDVELPTAVVNERIAQLERALGAP